VRDLNDVLLKAAENTAAARLARVAATTKTIADLRERGLLKKQEYRAATTADMEQRYAVDR
jgi:hypothetical protein